MAERNPYLILGIPFGTGRAEAQVAFGRRTKSVPADPAEKQAYLTELTWALHEIDAGSATPGAEMNHYRLPAGPGPGGSGVFTPPEEPGPYDEAAALARLRADAAREALRLELLRRAAGAPPPSP
jgi:hypothetical protein